jgi:hypothetical protein
MNVNIGDTVSVLDTGYTYEFYEEMAIHLGISKWKRGAFPSYKKSNYIVKDIIIHPRFKNRIIAWIEDIKTGQGYMIRTKALSRDFINVNEFNI